MTAAVTIRASAWPRLNAMEDILGFDVAGSMTRLWAWLLADDSRCPNGMVRGRNHIRQIEAVARWKGEPGKFVEAMEMVGFCVRQSGKLFLRGVEQYVNAWKQRKAAALRERERRAAVKRAAKAAAEATPPAERKKNVLDVLFEQWRSRKISLNSNDGVDTNGNTIENHPLGMWTFMMRERARDITRGNGLDTPVVLIRSGAPPDQCPPDGFIRWYSELKAEGVADTSIRDAWIRYLRDEAFSRKLWPLEIFMTEKVYRRRLTQSA